MGRQKQAPVSCYFCQASVELMRQDKATQTYVVPWFWTECPRCGMRGPRAHIEDAARLKWNELGRGEGG